MPIGTTNAISGPYYGDGVVVAFPFDFQVLTGDQVAIHIDGVEQSRSSFSVDLAGSAPSVGTVRLSSPPPLGAQVYVALDPSFAQDIEFADGAAWLADPVNRGYDQAALRDQALARDIGRALRLPMGDEAAVLPPADRRKGFYLGFDPITGAPALRSSSDPLSLTALGVPAGAINMGAFDGNLLSDGLTGKQVMQVLASALEGKDSDLIAIINDKNEIVTASIANEAIVRAHAISALAMQITSISASLGDNTSSIQSEAIARANAISALAAQISSISASVGDNAAAIHSEVTARADAIGALAAQISAFSASIGANTAAIQAETSARTDAVASVAAQISSLNTNYNGLSATVSGNYTALSNTIAAQAGSISSVQAQANGLAASVTAQAAAIANLGSADAYWRVTAVSGDNRASIELRASAGYAGFDITGNVRISGNLLVAGTLTSTAFVANGVTEVRQAYNGADFSGTNYAVTGTIYNNSTGDWEDITGPDYWDVITLTVNMNYAGDIVVLLAAKQWYYSGGRDWKAQLTIDGTEVFYTEGGTGAISDSIALSGKLSVGAGPHTVKFRWRSSDSTLVMRAGKASMVTIRRYV